MNMRRRAITAVVVCALATAAVETAAPSADAAPRWAPASKATIHPGVRTFTGGNPCRANFVFYDSRDVYLGQEAHCSGVDDLSWCPTTRLPLGTPVKIEGASRPGKVVYNSWLTMERVREGDGLTCGLNDFALVRIDKADRSKVNPSMPFWGGPTSAGGRSAFGARVYTVGNSEAYCWQLNCRPSAGLNTLSPRTGIDTTTNLWPPVPWGGTRPPIDTEGWARYVHTAAPGISGGRGTPVLDERGRALGILGWPMYDASDRITNLSKLIAYMKAKTKLDPVRLASGTTSFVAWP
jgi:hypothetical protein